MCLQEVRLYRYALTLAVLWLSMFSPGAAAQQMSFDSPPRVEVELIGTREMQLSPAGLPYFVAPVSVTPVVSVRDTGDSSPSVEIELNHQPYSPGIVARAPGLHTVRATIISRDGNPTTESLTFQIRERPVYEARTLVEDFECVEGPQGNRRIQGTLVLASDEFDTSQIHLSALGIWPVGDSGEWMTDQPIRVRRHSGSDDSGPEVQRALAEFESCAWVIEFVARFTAEGLAACPDSLAVTGRGLANEPDAFDLVSFSSTFPEPQGRSALIDRDGNCKDPNVDPPADDPVPCEWKIEPSPGPPAICSGSNASAGIFCAWGHSLFLRVDGDRFKGNSTAFASGAGLGKGCTAGLVCSQSKSMSYQVFQEGDNCCNDCTIQFMATPTFTATVGLTPNGRAEATGHLSVCPPCGCASASGTISVDHEDEAFAIINNIPFVTPLWGGAASISPIGNMSPCTVNACSATVSIAAEGSLSTQAYTSVANNYAQADAALTGASSGLQIKPSTNCDDQDPPEFNINIGRVQ